jgi:hypothetical protein
MFSYSSALKFVCILSQNEFKSILDLTLLALTVPMKTITFHM